MTTRYETIFNDDLPEALRADWRSGDFRWFLVEYVNDKPTRIVGMDGGEPEDQLLVRDWSWVADEMNRQAAAIDALRADSLLLSRIQEECGPLVEAYEAAGERSARAFGIPTRRAAEDELAMAAFRVVQALSTLLATKGG